MSAHPIIYKPDPHGDEYIVFIEDPKEYEDWKTDKSIALARFLGQFSIFKSGTGHTGTLGEVSKQEIETVFFDDQKNVKDKSIEAAIGIILEHGVLQKGDLAHGYKLTKNPARGAGDTRAPGAFQGSHR